MNKSDQKGQIAFLKVVLKLTELGYAIFIPLGEPKDVTDLVAVKDNKCVRFQIKYLGGVTYSVPRGNGSTSYTDTDFDYYALYYPKHDVVCFPSSKFRNCTIRLTPSGNHTPFYWYEDFLDLTDDAPKRTNNYISAITPPLIRDSPRGPRPEQYKQIRPSKETLNELIWSKPTTEVAKMFNMSDNGMTRWIKDYGLSKPPRGYWQKQQAAENK